MCCECKIHANDDDNDDGLASLCARTIFMQLAYVENLVASFHPVHIYEYI